MPAFPHLKSLTFASLLVAAVPAAMAQESAPQAQSAPQVVAAPQAESRTPTLDRDTVFKVILAEIAAARHQLELAAYLDLEAASRTRDPQLARRATELAMQSGLSAYITEAAKLWAQVDPDAKDPTRALALALAGEKARLEDLEPALRRMLEIESAPKSTLLMQLPALLVRYPDKAAALALTERLTQPYLQVPEAHLVRAVMALSAEDNAKAGREAQKALDLQPDSEMAARVRAQAAPASTKAQAMEELGRFVKRYPLARAARQDYARWLLSAKRYAQAVDAYSSLLAEMPGDEGVQFWAAVAFLLNGDAARSDALLKPLMEQTKPGPDALHLQLGEVLEQAGRPDEALAHYMAVSAAPSKYTARLRAAHVQVSRGKLEEALALMREAASQEGGDTPEIRLAEISLLVKLAHKDEAIKELDAFMAQAPENDELIYQAAMQAEELGEHERSERWLRGLTEKYPQKAAAFNALGYSFVDRNINLPEAERLLSTAIKLEPDNAAIIDSVGWLRFRQGRFKDAVTTLRRAYAKLDDPEIAAHLGQALWATGQKRAARSLLEAADKKHPDNAALKTAIEQLRGKK